MKRLFFLLLAGLLLLCRPASAQDLSSGQEGIHDYYAALAVREPTDNHVKLANLTDPDLIHKKMTVEQMSVFMGSTPFQTRMVYFYSTITGKEGADQLMTPHEFVHSLADDLFGRKALQGLVNKRQKEGLFLRRDLMDWADRGLKLPAEKLLELAASFDYYTF